jgi:hypothetical protein
MTRADAVVLAANQNASSGEAAMTGERALWRRIEDFKHGDVNSTYAAAETLLSDCARAGETADFSGRPRRAVRASFLRFLLLGGDDGTPVHESGVKIEGAQICGQLDLDQCETKAALIATDCEFTGGIVLTDAKFENFILEGCTIRAFGDKELGVPAALWGTRATAKGSVFFRRNTVLEGALRMAGAHVAGNLDLSGASISAVGSTAIDLENAAIDGDLELRATFPPGEAMPRADSGTVDLADERMFRVRGQRMAQGRLRLINLDNAHIGNRLRIFYARLKLVDETGATWSREGDANDYRALSGVGLKVDSGFEFHHVEKQAGVWLLGANLGILVDDLGSWLESDGENRFDGMIYGRIATESPHTFKDRRDWLLSQAEVDLKADPSSGRGGFKLQPWTFAAEALEKSGRAEDARLLRMEAEGQRDRGDPDGVMRLLRFFYWLFAGYGYSFRRLVWTAVLVFALGYLAAASGAYRNEFCVANGDALKNSPPAGGGLCPMPGASLERMNNPFWKVEIAEILDLKGKKADYPALYPLLYALENEIPGYSLDQKSFWRPAYGSLTNFLLSLQYTLGFLASAAILAHFGSKLIRGSEA